MRLALPALASALVAAGCGAGDQRLVTEAMIEGDAISAPLTDTPGVPERGQEIFTTRERGHCVLCHRVEGLPAEFQGDVGPDLTTVGARLSRGQLRLRIADPTRVWPETVMPPYYRKHDLNQVGAAYQGQPVLSAQEIEDVIAYLSGLTA